MDVFKIRNAVLLCIGFALLSEVNSNPNPDRGQTATRPDRGGGIGRNPNGMNGGNNANIQVPTEGPAEGANTQVPIQVPTEGPAEGDVRLVGGSASHEGRVEVYHNGMWGTVCDDNLAYYSYEYYATESANFATVVCRQLGFSSGTGVVKKMAYNFFGEGNDPTWLDNVYCSGSESRLDECSHNGWGAHNCDHHEDVGVICDI
ncbi:macrophage scavenger receptor types I and II-like isoform X4 [Amphiura filiformis]|uniref:macrophage scavenger receptor types I and II-like isoform X4 n=1 Tax=Amphiura filiformis TaxID=82378 RepID=UPI003B22483F